jgi:exosome complex RNA-binding protein Rrp4
MDNKNKVKQDGYKVNIDSKYGNYIKLGDIAKTPLSTPIRSKDLNMLLSLFTISHP